MNHSFMPFSVPSPAKINLFLHIIGRRQNGYHELQSGMQFLDFADILHFSQSTNNILEAPGSCGVLSDNLIWRALEALRPFAKEEIPVSIRLEKHLPIGGGLGGGSSNAATTLLVLNHLWKCGLSTQALQEIALKLGADVPFFVGGTGAFVEGIGEQLTPWHYPQSPLLLVFPACHSDTRTLYQHPQLTRDTPSITIATLDLKDTRNDFEVVARACYPAIDDALQWLSQFGRPQLSGSGASVFVLCRDLAAAHQAHAQLPSHLRGRVACTLHQSPCIQVVNHRWGVAKW